jgi:hypothetical protein
MKIHRDTIFLIIISPLILIALYKDTFNNKPIRKIYFDKQNHIHYEKDSITIDTIR